MTGRSVDQEPAATGEWYLEALGICPNGDAATLEQAGRDAGAGRTSELVTELWNRTAKAEPIAREADPLRDWRPASLSRTAASRRNVRWTVVVIAVAVGVTAAFTLWWLPQVSERRVTAHAELMVESIDAVYEDLAATQRALEMVTEPASTGAELESVGADLAGIAESSGRLLAVAGLEVPGRLPLGDAVGFEILETQRPGLLPLAAEATAIRSDIADVAGYRLAVGRVLVVDELPLTADSGTTAELSAALARSLADSVAALTVMPVSGPFADHRSSVAIAVEEYPAWQDNYLEALRARDNTAAEQLVAAFVSTRDGIQVQMVPALAALRSDIDGRILQLASSLSRERAALP